MFVYEMPLTTFFSVHSYHSWLRFGHAEKIKHFCPEYGNKEKGYFKKER
jgi:hypothetical protein